jgi:hypothetical protein
MRRLGVVAHAAAAPTASPTATTVLPEPAVDALQAALGGEHAVIWAYGVLGPRAGDARADLARDLLLVHGTARDTLRALLVGAGASPVAAEPAYTLPMEPTDPVSAAELAAALEERLAALYADLVASSIRPTVRSLAVDNLAATASRVAQWRGSAPALPGLPEYAAPPD